MIFKVIKTGTDGKILKNFGKMTIEEVKAFALTFIPEVFANKSAANNAVRVIKVEGADDWFVSGPAIISIRRVDE